MLQATATPLSAMDPATMRAVYNFLAEERGQPLAPKTSDRVILGKGIALLRTMPKAKAADAPKPVRRRDPVAPRARNIEPRPSIIRDRALVELARVVAYYNTKTGEEISAANFEASNLDGDQWASVGAPLVLIAEAIRKDIPNSRISPGMLRKYVHHVRRAVAVVSAGKPLDPSLEGFANCVLPERRPKSRKGIYHGRRKPKRTATSAGSANRKRADAERRRKAISRSVAKRNAKRRASRTGRKR